MASTKIGESGVQADKPVRKTRFVAAPDAGAAPGDADPTGDGNVPGALMSRRAAIGGVCMGAAALLCFLAGAGLSGGEATVSHDKAQQIVSLREQIRTAEVRTDALPEAGTSPRTSPPTSGRPRSNPGTCWPPTRTSPRATRFR
jgi:hypothetical protein